jgi:tricarballylate dehydrogenase
MQGEDRRARSGTQPIMNFGMATTLVARAVAGDEAAAYEAATPSRPPGSRSLPMSPTLDADVIVVGAGNAACAAAVAARNKGARVIMLEAAPQEERGGNSTYTAGAMRTVHNGTADVVELVPDLSAEMIATTDFGTYTADQFRDDMYRITNYKTDPELCEILVEQSLPTMKWMREQGIRFQPSYGRQAFKVDGKFKFWGGLAVEIWGGGPGLVDMWHAAAEKKGITVHYETEAIALIAGDHGIEGVEVRSRGKKRQLRAKAVVLACGGFESNAEMRVRYLGHGYDLAKVRGTRFNTGNGHKMAMEQGAMPWGHWSGAHAVGWDLNAPPFGDLTVGDNFQKHSYPLGIMLNARGERFVDEGADFRNYTYAKYGHVIQAQPDSLAWQIFDAKVLKLLRDEYRIKRVTKVSADTLEALVQKLEGVDPVRALATIREWNGAVMTDVPFNPAVKDGRGTRGLAVPKSNWANTLDEPPFEAYAVTCGVTFTFGGLKIDAACAVEDTAGQSIPGLFAAGEIVGGLFYFNYPGGTGLVSGAVFGKIAGESAADAAGRNT